MIHGKTSYLNRLYSRIPLKGIVLSQHMEGLTPPSVFVGRHGYPKVNVGPMMSVGEGDISIMDRPEDWYNKKAEDARLELTNILLFTT